MGSQKKCPTIFFVVKSNTFFHARTVLILLIETALMLLLVADVLVPINRFSMFLQRKTLIYADISHKFQQLLERIENLQGNDGGFFKENAIQFLTISQNRMELAQRTKNARLLS